MEAAKVADIFGSFLGTDVQHADAEEACVQAPMTSPVNLDTCPPGAVAQGMGRYATISLSRA